MDKQQVPRLKTAFVLQLKNCFQVLADIEDPGSHEVKNKWEQVKAAYSKSSGLSRNKAEVEEKDQITTSV